MQPASQPASPRRECVCSHYPPPPPSLPERKSADGRPDCKLGEPAASHNRATGGKPLLSSLSRQEEALGHGQTRTSPTARATTRTEIQR